MAATTSIKPFSPEETRRILDHLQHPAIFPDATCGWPVLNWTAEHLSGCLGGKLIRFRLGRKEETKTPLFETQCSYVEAKLDQFLSWTRGRSGPDVGPFSEYPHSEYWAYADYKYIAVLFQDQPSMFEDVKWSEFGYEGRDGRDSTLWIGTEGANTPCHLDSYGCNLVLQVQGRKRWHLFPPEDTASLYPTRVPYEESSVFSQVDVLLPDLRRFPAFQGVRAHVVTLEPGQEGKASHDENMRYVNLALRACAQRQQTQSPRDPGSVKRDSSGRVKKNRDCVRNRAAFGVPFGPHLIPVRCQQEEPGMKDPEAASGSMSASAVRLHEGKHECRSGLTRTRPCDRAGGAPELSSGDHKQFEHATITTNDLLDCLVHPDVITRVTELLLERHMGSHMNTKLQYSPEEDSEFD